MRSLFFLTLFCTAFCVSAFSQQIHPAPGIKQIKNQQRRQHIADVAKKDEEGALVYNKQFLLGFKLNTDGWTGFYEHDKYKDITTSNGWFLEFGERKSHKEEKLTNIDGNGFPVGNPLIYGKQNVFFNVNIGINQQKLIGGKGAKNGVAVSLIYGGGFSAGLLKPYYVTIQDSTGGTTDIKYSGPQDSAFLLAPPFSSAGFSKGLNETKFVPGAVVHAGLRFDYGRYNEVLSAIEFGLSAEIYSKGMPIIVTETPKKFFYNAYVAIEFGKRK